MKLLIATPWPLSSAGGGQRLAAGIAGALADRGVDVVVAAGSGLSEPPIGVVRGARFREIRLPLLGRPGLAAPAQHESPHDSLHLAGLEALAEQARPDAILYTPHYSSCAQQALTLATELRVPLVLWPAIHLDERRQTGRAARQFYRSAALVLCLSDVEHAWLRRVGLPPERLLTLGCGWSGSETRARQVAPASPLRLLTVGAYVRHKQLDHQLEALEILRRTFHVDAYLTIAGTCREPSVADRLRQLARRRGLENQVAFVTDCASSVIARLHAASDFFLFTSRSESFGVSVLDAVGFGTFPIVYPHPVYRELVESSRFGMVARRSTPKALARAVFDAATAPTVRSDQQQRLQWLAERSWPRIANMLGDALDRVRSTAAPGTHPYQQAMV